MYQFDAFTIHSILFIGNIFTILFLLAYRIIHPQKNDKLLIYILAKFFQSIMWLIYMFDSEIAVRFTASRIISDSSHVFGIVLELYCLITIGRNYGNHILYFLLSLPLLFTTSIILVNTELFEIVSISYIVGAALMFTWYQMAIKSGNSRMRKVVGWLSFLIAIIQFSRGSAFFSQTYINAIVNEIDPLYYYLAVGLLIITFSFPLLFMVLQKENDALLIQEIDKKISDQNKQLKSLNATKDRFFSIISHDLRSPIGSIINLLSLIESDTRIKHHPDIDKIVTLVSDSAQKSFTLLENLLYWSRVQRNELSSRPTSFLLRPRIENELRLTNANSQSKFITVEIDVDPELTVYTDQLMLDTIVRNLLSNAIKFTSDYGLISIFAFQNNDEIVLVVTDNGVGIQPENLEKLFRIEDNISTFGTRKEKGTGLGLILCKEFAERMGGKIEVTSMPGNGSTFKITFPNNLQ